MFFLNLIEFVGSIERPSRVVYKYVKFSVFLVDRGKHVFYLSFDCNIHAVAVSIEPLSLEFRYSFFNLLSVNVSYYYYSTFLAKRFRYRKPHTLGRSCNNSNSSFQPIHIFSC